MAPGGYRVQVQHATMLTKSDEQRDPFLLQAMKRLISTRIQVASADLVLGTVETSNHAYGQMSPNDAGTFSRPMIFTYTMLPGATLAHASVYGTANDGGSPNIGDPWFNSPNNTSTQASWDGGFTTAMANEAFARPNERYFWGTNHDFPTDAGISWSGQSMVLPFHVN